MATPLRRLAAEFSKLTESSPPGVVARPRDPSSMMIWDFTIAGPEGSHYEDGIFCGTLTFPADYPLSPPKMVFTTAMTHPNVYGPGARAGEVCISILHAGRDVFGYERIEERWCVRQAGRSAARGVV